MKISATIQARMASSRLPGKVLKPILGKPMLAHQIQRIQRSLLIDEVIIATSTEKQDDPIEHLAQEMGIGCFRGSEDDVLSRVVGALQTFNVGVHVEFLGDNPIPDPLLIDSIIGLYLKNTDRYDYVTNSMKTTYPPGAEVSVYSAKVLYEAERLVTETSLREHVSIHINQHPEKFRIQNIEAPPEFHHPNLHLEVDTQEDFDVITKIFEHFHPNQEFCLAQVIEYMNANPEVASLNSGVERRWKKFRQE